MKDSITKNNLYFLISLSILLILWQVIANIINWNLIFPTPVSTFREIITIVTGGDFFKIIILSLYRSFISFFLSGLLGIILGGLAGRFIRLDYLFRPIISVIRAIPTIAIILIALVWLSTDMVPVFVGFLVSFPIIYSSILSGYKSIDKKLIEMGKLYKIGRKKMFKEIYLPSIIPFLNVSIVSGFGLNLKVIIASEVISQPGYGIGTSLQIERYAINAPGLFAWSIIVITIVFFIEKVLKRVLCN